MMGSAPVVWQKYRAGRAWRTRLQSFWKWCRKAADIVPFCQKQNKTSKGKSQSRTNSVKGDKVGLITPFPQKLRHLVTPGEGKKNICKSYPHFTHNGAQQHQMLKLRNGAISLGGKKGQFDSNTSIKCFCKQFAWWSFKHLLLDDKENNVWAKTQLK